MKKEPVAWMLNGIIHECDPSDWAKEQYPDQDVIPLYTHPVKELTDDELFHVIRRIGYTSIDQTDEIVEAIRKAQEK